METNWKFTPLNGKKPIGKNWNKQPMDIFGAASYHGATGIGLLLGEPSGGVVALDFDGEEAWIYFESLFGAIDQFDIGYIWASGKPYRCQIAWSVEEEFWSLLKTIKCGPNHKLEFRWTGSQSVMPPSIHPDTGKEYVWELEDKLYPIPNTVLEYWYTECSKTITVDLVSSSVKDADIKVMNSILKNLHLMKPEDTNSYSCKIWNIIDHNKFSLNQKHLIMNYYCQYDSDIHRQQSIATKLKER